MILYDLLYLILIILTFPYWIVKMLSGRYHAVLPQRLKPQCPLQHDKTIWLHAASVGEVMSLVGLVKKLSEELGKKVVVSVTTPSGANCARRHLTRATVIHAPLDLSPILKKFIRTINPQLFILNELEIWPNWIRQLKRHAVPIMLINGRMGEKARRRYRFLPFILRPSFRAIDYFLLQAELYREHFLELGARPESIVICGNSKADEAWSRAAILPEKDSIAKRLGLPQDNRPIITLASSHASDEDFFLPLLKRISRRFYPIIVPRHPQRRVEIEKKMADLGLKSLTWNPGINADPETEVLLFAEMGHLNEILAVSDIVIMGGTREKRIAGHNLYEPASLGKVILGGKYLQSFPDIGAELLEKGIYRFINQAEDLLAFLESWPGNVSEETAELAREAVQKRRGSQQCILDRVLSLTAA